MRCAVDTHTMPLNDVPRLPAEREQLALPGVPVAPVKAPRTTQAQRMELMGYEGPKDRPSCASCVWSSWSPEDLYAIRCTKGDFPVLRGGLCRQWTAA